MKNLFKFLDWKDITIGLNIWQPAVCKKPKETTTWFISLALKLVLAYLRSIFVALLEHDSPYNSLLTSLVEFVRELLAIRGRDGFCKHVVEESVINEAGVKMWVEDRLSKP